SFSNKFKTFYNYSTNERWSFTPNLDVVDELYNSSTRISTDLHWTTGIGATYTISPSMISETRINYYRFRNDTTWPGYGTDFSALLGIPNIGKGSMPNITNGTTSAVPFVTNPSLNVEETFNYKEDISKLSGKHAFKGGYDL